MEKEKKQKVLKIVGFVLFALAVAAVVTFCIVSAVYKDKTNDLNNKNQQIEDLLDKQTQSSLLRETDILF